MRGKATKLIGSALIIALPFVAACGGSGDDDNGEGASSTTEAAGGAGGDGAVRVVAKDSLKFDEKKYEADAGEVHFVLENDGNIVHTLLVKEVDDFKLTVSGRGEEDEGSVELEPGTYQLYCDIAGHSSMKATLEVIGEGP